MVPFALRRTDLAADALYLCTIDPLFRKPILRHSEAMREQYNQYTRKDSSAVRLHVPQYGNV